MMYLLLLAIFVGCFHQSLQWGAVNYGIYEETSKVKDICRRLIVAMRTYAIEADRRIAELNPLRFMFEESPHYEQGYVFAEIIERYKKIVEHYQRLLYIKSQGLHEYVDKLNHMHNKFFEIQQLVNMMHEIKLKYRMVPEFHSDSGGAVGEYDVQSMIIRNQFLQEERERMKQRKKELGRLHKMRQNAATNISAARLTTRRPGAKPTSYNLKRWPLDYGWEIESW